MKTILALLISIFILATSCHKEKIPATQTDANGVIISQPFVWKRSLHLANPVSNSGISAQVYYNDNFLSPITNGGNNRKLAMINSDNGEILWQWDDRYQPLTEDVDIDYYHRYNNLLTYQCGGRSYCINLDNGTTHWRIRRDKSFDVRLYPYQNSFYFSIALIINQAGYDEGIVYKGDIQTGVLQEFLRANLSASYAAPIEGLGGNGCIGDISYVNEIPSNKDLLLVTYTEPLPNWYFNTFYGLYNTQTNEWIWDRKLLAIPRLSSGVNTPPIIFGNNVYAAISNSIVCHDITTGTKLWQKDFNGDFMFSGFIIEDNRIIANCEDTYTYCLNPENGNLIWRTAGSGTSSRLAYLNGIVYFSGGGDGFLHAVDVSNGKKVWKLKADNIDKTIFASYNPVYVLSAKGNKPARVFAHTLGHVVCYKAYR